MGSLPREGASIPFFHEMPDGFFSRGSFLIAKYSYGIYLSHLPLLWLCFRRLHTSLAMSCLLFSVLATLVPFLLYHLIEDPAIQLGRRLTAAS
jgi:peptidoglycan/LPS O-acetylase OafA/YrhL